MIVADSNIVFAYATQQLSERASSTITQSLIIAPYILPAEIGNILWKYVRFEKMDIDLAKLMYTESLGLIDQIVSRKEIEQLAMDLAIKHKLSYYDGLFLSTSVIYKAPICTLDKKLIKAAKADNIYLDI